MPGFDRLGSFCSIDRTWAMINRHVQDVAAGQLRVVVDRTFPLAEAAAAHAYIESRKAVGRVAAARSRNSSRSSR